MPSASVRIATIVKPRLRCMTRKARRTSRIRLAMRRDGFQSPCQRQTAPARARCSRCRPLVGRRISKPVRFPLRPRRPDGVMEHTSDPWREGLMKAKTLALVAIAGIAILASMPAAAVEKPTAVPNVEVVPVEGTADACLNYTPVEATQELPELSIEVDGTDATPAAKPPKGCKACPDQPWCACTYNGHPRVSCDPCCYSTWSGEICTS